MYNNENIKNKTEFEKLKEECPDLVFKPEGLGAIEFTKKVVLKTFEQEEIKFRIERVPLQAFSKIAGQLEKMSADNLLKLDDALKTFISFPVEARKVEYFNLDVEAMVDILGVAAEFQTTPFLYIKGTREAEAGSAV